MSIKQQMLRNKFKLSKGESVTSITFAQRVPTLDVFLGSGHHLVPVSHAFPAGEHERSQHQAT